MNKVKNLRYDRRFIYKQPCLESLVFFIRRLFVEVCPRGGGGDSHMKQTRMLVGNFEFYP